MVESLSKSHDLNLGVTFLSVLPPQSFGLFIVQKAIVFLVRQGVTLIFQINAFQIVFSVFGVARKGLVSQAELVGRLPPGKCRLIHLPTVLYKEHHFLSMT
jgi:hypothetical protein